MSQNHQNHNHSNTTNKKNKHPDKITIPISYPNSRFPATNIAKPSDQNVEYAKEWVDFHQL